MEKINVAELLKDCPKGMELDCTMYDDVTLDRVSDKCDYPIIISTKNGFPARLTKYGQNVNIEDAKCVIFPKGKTTWEGFVPPCQFKDGDIVYTRCDNGDGYIFIFENITENTCVNSYLHLKGDDLRINKVWLTNCDDKYLRLATEEEKQKLFQAIKDNGYKWNAETKTLEKLINRNKFVVGNTITNGKIVGKIHSKDVDSYQLEDGTYVFFNEVHNWELVPNKFDISTLVSFESRVLVRSTDDDIWRPAIYGFTDSERYYVVGGIFWRQCIPYEVNKELLGTTNDCDEYYKLVNHGRFRIVEN